jgi:hypothetical protein
MNPRNAAFKRAIYPWLMIVPAIVFVLILVSRVGASPILLLVIPWVGVIYFFNLRRIQVCGRCGATVVKTSGFSPPQFCSECATPLSSPTNDPGIGSKENDNESVDMTRGATVAPSWRSWRRASRPSHRR